MVVRMLSPPGPRRSLELLRLRFVPEVDWAYTLYFAKHVSDSSMRCYCKEGQAEAHARARSEEGRLQRKLNLSLSEAAATAVPPTG